MWSTYYNSQLWKINYKQIFVAIKVVLHALCLNVNDVCEYEIKTRKFPFHSVRYVGLNSSSRFAHSFARSFHFTRLARRSLFMSLISFSTVAFHIDINLFCAVRFCRSVWFAFAAYGAVQVTPRLRNRKFPIHSCAFDVCVCVSIGN